MIKIAISICAAGLLVSACQHTDAPTKSKIVDLEALAALMENSFATPPENTDSVLRDRRVRVSSDALEGVWFYTQINRAAEEKVYRQRLSHLTLSEDGKSVVQNAYGLKTPEKYTDAWNTPGLLSSISADDYDPYFDGGCEQAWTPEPDGGWTGYVDPLTCIIKSKRRNQEIRIESEGYLSKDEFRTNERGFDKDMNFLWGSKPGEMITLYPTR